MFNYAWPIGLVVLSNVMYHICAKAAPEGMDPFASLTVTYLIGAAVSAILFVVLNKDVNFVDQYKHLNWAPFALGIVIVGLEVGTIYAYKVGWQISVESIVQSAFCAVVLIFVGWFIYHEAMTWNKIVGIVVCLAGLAIINLK